MRTVHFQSYRLTFEPLSPVHIGAGEPIEPYEYDLSVHRRNHKGDVELGVLTALDVDRLLAELSPRQQAEFQRRTKAMTSRTFPEIRRWLREQADARHHRFHIAVPPHAYQELAGSWDSPRRQSEIHLLPRQLPGGDVFLPGSAIKGAVRTAVLDQALGEQSGRSHEWNRMAAEAGQNRNNPRPENRFQAAVLDYLDHRGRPNLNRDPFRQLAVSDISIPDKATYIDQVQIIRPLNREPVEERRRGSAEGILMYREVLRCHALNDRIRGTGELRLFPQLADPRVMTPDSDGRPTVLPRALSIRDICRWCNAFYRPRLVDELQRFARDETRAARLQALADDLNDHQCLIRVGRHSHVECVTVREPYRRASGGKSRSYASDGSELGRLPLGWACLTFHPQAENHEVDHH